MNQISSMRNKTKLWCSKCKDSFHAEYDLFSISETGLCSVCCLQEGSRQDICTMPNWFQMALDVNDHEVAKVRMFYHPVPVPPTPVIVDEKTKSKWLVKEQKKVVRQRKRKPLIIFSHAKSRRELYEKYDEIHPGLCQRCGKKVLVRSWKVCDECTG